MRVVETIKAITAECYDVEKY